METVIIEKTLFEEILKQIGFLSHQVESLKKKQQDKSLSEWLDTQETCSILKISPKTLQSYRETGKIGYSQINRKFYYKVDDIRKMLNQKILKM